MFTDECFKAPSIGPTETTGTSGNRTVGWDYPRLPEPKWSQEPLTLDTEQPALVCGFGIIFAMLQSLPFEIGMFTLCCCMLEVTCLFYMGS